MVREHQGKQPNVQVTLEVLTGSTTALLAMGLAN
jgi:hypothetical protein